MNKKQKYALLVILFVLLIQLIFYTPYYYKSPIDNRLNKHLHGNLFNPPHKYATLEFYRFIIYWGIILVFGGTVVLLLQDKKKN